MEYVKREEVPASLYTAAPEGPIHNVIYHNHQLPLNLVEQIQLAVQNTISTIPDAIPKNPIEPHLTRMETRDLTISLEPDHRGMIGSMENRVDQGLAMVGHREVQGLRLGAQRVQQGTLPLPFQIKSEQDVDDNVYFYDHMMNTYSTNVTTVDHTETITPDVHNEHAPIQYIFNGHTAAINTASMPTTEQFQRQQNFFHSYTANEGNPENLVIHRQYENVSYIVADDMKRERVEIDKIHSREDHPNENVKPMENKMYYADYDANGCYSKSDADVIPNKYPDDTMYKSLIEAEYANIKGEYSCFNCKGVFPSKRGLKQHAKSCPEEGRDAAEKVGKFSCTQCPYKCQSPAILKIHERTHTGEKPFSCSFCNYKSGQKNNVAKHILVHMKEKPFRCQYCDYRCAQKNNLVVHERTHTGFKPFACTLCDYKTVQKPNLVKHMYLHTGQKPFGCDVCSYRCVQKTNLTKHKQRHLNEKGEKMEYVNKNANKPYRPRQKSFKCGACPFRSVQKTGLEKHVEFKHGGDARVDSEAASEESYEGARKTCDSNPEQVVVEGEYPVPGQGLNLMKGDVKGSDRGSGLYSEPGVRQQGVDAHTSEVFSSPRTS